MTHYPNLQPTILRDITPQILADHGELMQQLDSSFNNPTPARNIENFIHFVGRDLFVVFDDGKLVGTASMNTVYGSGLGACGQLEDLSVHREHRRKHIGMGLLFAAHDWTASMGHDFFQFDTEPKRTEAVQLYDKFAQQLGTPIQVPGTWHYRVPVIK